jgi:hypothetical protein
VGGGNAGPEAFLMEVRWMEEARSGNVSASAADFTHH